MQGPWSGLGRCLTKFACPLWETKQTPSFHPTLPAGPHLGVFTPQWGLTCGWCTFPSGESPLGSIHSPVRIHLRGVHIPQWRLTCGECTLPSGEKVPIGECTLPSAESPLENVHPHWGVPTEECRLPSGESPQGRLHSPVGVLTGERTLPQWGVPTGQCTLSIGDCPLGKCTLPSGGASPVVPQCCSSSFKTTAQVSAWAEGLL
jgi:hypothetical protein